MSKSFHFKQFSIAQDRCAMKVGTDGVLLGAWAKMPEGGQSALDIGTGTGVIALMLAQRFSEVQVKGIDIDESAAKQAEENFRTSPFTHQLSVEQVALQDFQTDEKYDYIVSNPPFFTNGILPENKQRQLARHFTDFSLELLFDKVSTLLAARGIFSIIMPISEQENILKTARENGLYCQESCVVYPNPNKAAKRILLSFSFQKRERVHSTLTIETDIRHHYTSEYKELLKDFYLAF